MHRVPVQCQTTYRHDEAADEDHEAAAGDAVLPISGTYYIACLPKPEIDFCFYAACFIYDSVDICATGILFIFFFYKFKRGMR